MSECFCDFASVVAVSDVMIAVVDSDDDDSDDAVVVCFVNKQIRRVPRRSSCSCGCCCCCS